MKNNVIKHDLWDQITKRKKEVYKENTYIWEPQKFDDYPTAEVEYVDKAWVSDVIGKARLANMKDGDCLFLSAQTGSGKSTLIFKHILPLAYAHSRKVLYLSSRIALCMQIKAYCMSDEFSGEIQLGKRKVKDLKRILSEEGLNEQIGFGVMDVLTYQKFLHIYDDLNFADYEYVCIDEAHCFISDNFNPTMEVILNTLVSKCSSSKRIYMTATPHESITTIYETEKLYRPDICGHRKFPIIMMSHDYQYVQPIFFSRTKEIISKIKEKAQEHWLIFVRNKEVGSQIQGELIQENILSEIFTADSDKDCRVYQDIISKEKMSTNILITTRVLDVGISIKNKDDKFNIVIFEDDIIEILQMVGRKRVENCEEITVYFYAPAITDLKACMNSLTHKENLAEKLVASIQNQEFLERIEPPAFLHGEKLLINSLFFKKNNYDRVRYQALYEKMAEFDHPFDQRKAYALALLSNFEGIEFDHENLFMVNPREAMANLLDPRLGKAYFKDEFKELALAIKEIHGDIRVKGSEAAPGIVVVNKMLSHYGYMAVSSGQPTTYTFYRKEDENNV